SQGSLIEKNITFDIALRLKNALTKAGFKAVLTRTKDIDMSAAERAGAANLAKADLLVSIHTSGSPGVGIYTMDEGDFDSEGAPDRAPLLWDDQNAPYLPDCLKLAKAVKESVGRVYEGADPQVHQARLAGIAGAAMPAIEVEIGSLSDQKQAEQLADDSFRGRLAVRLEKGIESFARGGEVEPTRKK
ncbi:MAG TPA: N-acetylmuramoyl-L-alanine amidase, partial [Nitrospirota bacterium]